MVRGLTNAVVAGEIIALAHHGRGPHKICVADAVQSRRGNLLSSKPMSQIVTYTRQRVRGEPQSRSVGEAVITVATETDHPALRRALDRIVVGLAVERHPASIAELATRISHTIEIAHDPTVAVVEIDSYTCFWHAFDLVGSSGVRKIAECTDLSPDSKFVRFLLAAVPCGNSSSDGRDGYVVVYRHGSTIKHAGKVQGTRIISKWGVGQLWNHRLFEVPGRYGSRGCFFCPLPREVVEAAFVEYAKGIADRERIAEILAL